MPAGPLALIALFGQLAASQPVYGPSAPDAPKPVVKVPSPTPDNCERQQKATNDHEIVVCAPRSDGYRINKDIMQAKKDFKAQQNRPNPPPNYAQNSCATVGPMGCMGQGTAAIDLISAGLVLATMARRAMTGGNVGQMFITNPQKSEYEFYTEAKQRREAEEKAAAAKQIAEAARAKAAAAAAAAKAQPATATP